MKLNKKSVLITDGFDADLFQQLKTQGQFELQDTPKLELKQIHQLLPKAHALVVRSKTLVNAELFSQVSPSLQLQLVIRAGAGLDNIDIDFCKSKNIAVFNTPGANGISAGELAIGLLFSTLRQSAKADQLMQSGVWEKNKFTGYELTGKKVGILGFGKIGSMVSKQLSGFDIQQFYYDPALPSNFQSPAYATRLHSLKELFGTCNIVSIHTPLMKETHHLVNYDLLSLMPRPSFLVNAARGEILNTNDLLRALDEKVLTGAGLDVYEKEPLEKNSPLLGRDNLVLTPHIGASTHEAQHRVGLAVIDILKEQLL